jgi:hypothetical protein
VSKTTSGSPEHKKFKKAKSDNKKKTSDNHKLSDRNVWDLRFTMVRPVEYEQSKQSLFKLVDIMAYHGIIKPDKKKMSKLCELNCGYGYRTGRKINSSLKTNCTSELAKLQSVTKPITKAGPEEDEEDEEDEEEDENSESDDEEKLNRLNSSDQFVNLINSANDVLRTISSEN